MSAAGWPPDGPLTRWALDTLAGQGEPAALEMRRVREEESRRCAERAEELRVVRDLHEVCGMCPYAIAREIGVSCEMVRRRLDAAGVPRRRWR